MALIIFFKKFSLLFLLISAPFLSTSFAGRRTKFADKLANQVDATRDEEISSNPSENLEEETVINERHLRSNSRDYGNYDPAPARVRPPFKLIPN